MSSMKNLFPALIIVALLVTVAYAMSSQVIFNNTGTVVTHVSVAAYHEAASENPVTLIDWDPIDLGLNASEVIYLNSTSNVPITLALTTTAWDPPLAESFIDLTWDLEGSTINPGEVVEATLTLTVSPDTLNVTSFIFTTVIDAVE